MLLVGVPLVARNHSSCVIRTQVIAKRLWKYCTAVSSQSANVVWEPIIGYSPSTGCNALCRVINQENKRWKTWITINPLVAKIQLSLLLSPDEMFYTYRLRTQTSDFRLPGRTCPMFLSSYIQTVGILGLDQSNSRQWNRNKVTRIVTKIHGQSGFWVIGVRPKWHSTSRLKRCIHMKNQLIESKQNDPKSLQTDHSVSGRGKAYDHEGILRRAMKRCINEAVCIVQLWRWCAEEKCQSGTSIKTTRKQNN